MGVGSLVHRPKLDDIACLLLGFILSLHGRALLHALPTPSQLGAIMACAAEPSLAAEGAAAAAVAAAPAAAVAAPPPKKRARAPKIDIDQAIAVHNESVKKAMKLVAEARRDVRNEKRRKQRLVKKAASLSSADLQRIAVLKRCGLWDPAHGLAGAGSVEAPASEAGAGPDPAEDDGVSSTTAGSASAPPSAAPSPNGEGAEGE